MAIAEQEIAKGKDALERHAWQEAYETLSDLDRDDVLSGEGLHLLSQAAYWSGRPDETIETLERAYSAYLKEGDEPRAAYIAFRVAEQYGMRMALSQVQGWGKTAGRLAEKIPRSEVHGWLIWMAGLMDWLGGNFESAIARYDEAMEFADDIGDPDLHAMSLHDKGHALCLQGKVDEGMPLLDEVMTRVVGGELRPEAAGYVYCGMIGACSRLGDYQRASEWTEATLRWCERQSVPAFPGVCRVHKAELMRLQGSLSQAEAEALAACEELPRFNLQSGLGPANYEIGEIRRRLGDFEGAEEAFANAHEFGHNSQPGLSLFRLAQGKLDAAASGIREAIAQAAGNHCAKIRLLFAQVEISLASDDTETAAEASEELDSLVAEFTASSFKAMAACARGALLLAQDSPDAALGALREANQQWQAVEAPFESAEVRLLLAKAYQAVGDIDAATREAQAALRAFERLGAKPAEEIAHGLLEALTGSADKPDRVERAFLFTDIVKSTDLVGVIGDEAWEDLLAWHDRKLHSLFDTNGGEVSHHTGDGFFVAFPDPTSAIHCAVEIQRALVEHRRSHGFALGVRIGIHAGEGSKKGADYSGSEVHKAARIAALAEGGQIVVSEDTAGLTDGRFEISEVTEVELKGFADPVSVGKIEWR